ncbi:unnamed protein product [marine sediment metagenome]|uniref:Uncharacterized protein n=1 Tax=marine sediment metagenome TaxID=412755 RepID=X1TKJ1_9ZZZZ
MGNIRSIRELFRGREFWRSINKFLGIVVYTIVFVGIMSFPMYLGYVFFVLAITVPSYVAFFINHLREMEREKKGGEVIGGWVEHDHGQGEPYYFDDIEDIQPYERLSEYDRTKVDELVDLLVKQAKVQKEIAVGDKEPEPVKQIPFKVPTLEEFKKFDDKDRKKYEAGWLKLSDQLIKKNELIKMDKIKEIVDKIEDEQENDK